MISSRFQTALPAQVTNCTDEAAEDAGKLGERLRRQDEVDDLQRLERVHEQRRDLLHETHQAGQRRLEPGPGARNRIGLLACSPRPLPGR